MIKVVKIIGNARINIGVIMGHGMECDGMAFVCLADNKAIVAGTRNKECGFNIVFFEDIKKFSGIWAGAVIKS